MYTSVRPKQTTKEIPQARPTITNVGSEELPDITVEETKAAFDEMKKTSPGEDGVPIEAIKVGGVTLLKTITALFNVWNWKKFQKHGKMQ